MHQVALQSASTPEFERIRDVCADNQLKTEKEG